MTTTEQGAGASDLGKIVIKTRLVAAECMISSQDAMRTLSTAARTQGSTGRYPSFGDALSHDCASGRLRRAAS